MQPPENAFLIGQREGFSPDLATLVSMMEYTRFTTLQEVQGLSVAELDFLHHPEGNTIGMLLLHMAAVETAYQIFTFENREELTPEEALIWEDALDLTEKARNTIRGFPLEHYLQVLQEVRTKTMEGFQQRDDAFLQVTHDWWYDLPGNNYFAWFHVFEDELNHRGQIRLIKKRYLQQEK